MKEAPLCKLSTLLALFALLKLLTQCNICQHIGQFLQGGKNGRLMSFFF